MQNKPKVKYTQNNVSSFITSKYVKMDNWCNQKNKPNSNLVLSVVEWANQTQSPKSQNERKLNFNKGLQKKR